MIRKYTFGAPLPTDAVIQNLLAEKDSLRADCAVVIRTAPDHRQVSRESVQGSRRRFLPEDCF